MCCYMAAEETFHKFILLLLVIIFAKIIEADISTNGSQENLSGSNNATFHKSTCKVVDCKISCFNGDESYLYYDIKIALLQNNISNCKIFDELLIYNYTFDDRTIPQKWTPIQEKVKSLKIILSDIEIIKDAAFENLDLTELSLQNLKLRQLDCTVLLGLRKLEKLEIKQATNETLKITRDFLKPVEFSLIELTVNADLHSPKNLTKSNALLNTLIKVDLSYNNFNRLGANDFRKLSMVEELNLSHSNITFLLSGIFADLCDTLRLLDLSHNQLVTFNASIFKSPLSSVRTNLILEDNPWKCTCGFRQLLQMLPIDEIHKVVCRSPDEHFGVPILQANMSYCSNPRFVHPGLGILFPGLIRPKRTTTRIPFLTSNTTTDISAVTSEFQEGSKASTPYETNNLQPETGNPRTMMKLKCKVCNVVGPYCNKTTANPEFITIRVKPKNLDFSISAISDTSVAVKIKHAAPVQETYSLLWFSRVTKDFFKMEINYKEYGLGCFQNINNTIYVHDLHANSTYTFCLIYKHHSTTSPFNCMGYRLPNYYHDNDAWLSEGAKTICISLTVLSIIFSTFLGGTTVFCLIKRKPRLLRGSKRVYKPKKSSPDIMVLPRSGSLSKEMKGHYNPCFVPNSRLHLRRSSSVDSSYVSPNYYEIIPPRVNRSCPMEDGIRIYATVKSPTNRKHRMSNDPLPEIPIKTITGINFSNRCDSGSSA